MINIKRSSTTHVVLSYLRMRKSNSVSLQDIYNFNPNKFQHPYIVKRALDRLIKKGFVTCKDSCYTITVQGVYALPKIVQQQPVENNERSSLI